MPSPYRLLSGPSSHLSTLSSVGLEGNLLFTTDTQQVYVGTGAGVGVPTGWVLIGGPGATGVSQIIAGTNITLSPTSGVGAVTVNSTGGGGGGFYTAFADAEQVSGSGTSWTLANTPTGDLQLFQYLTGFGCVALIQGIDFAITGAAITTTNSIASGKLYAWYQYDGMATPTFVGDETVAGSGTAWTLANVPNPPASLQLVQRVTGFGGITLIEGIDYTLSGAGIVTTNSILSGDLTAWYRY